MHNFALVSLLCMNFLPLFPLLFYCVWVQPLGRVLRKRRSNGRNRSSHRFFTGDQLTVYSSKDQLGSLSSSIIAPQPAKVLHKLADNIHWRAKE